MDFLESAAILLPAATGMALTIYDGDPNILAQFEQQYCFAAHLYCLWDGGPV